VAVGVQVHAARTVAEHESLDAAGRVVLLTKHVEVRSARLRQPGHLLLLFAVGERARQRHCHLVDRRVLGVTAGVRQRIAGGAGATHLPDHPRDARVGADDRDVSSATLAAAAGRTGGAGPATEAAAGVASRALAARTVGYAHRVVTRRGEE